MSMSHDLSLYLRIWCMKHSVMIFELLFSFYPIYLILLVKILALKSSTNQKKGHNKLWIFKESLNNKPSLPVAFRVTRKPQMEKHSDPKTDPYGSFEWLCFGSDQWCTVLKWRRENLFLLMIPFFNFHDLFCTCK